MQSLTFNMTQIEKLSIIIPFRQSNDRPEALWRLWNQLSYLKKICPESEIIISDQSLFAPISFPAALYFSADYVWNPSRVYSPASCKNAGAKKSSNDLILFLDIDVVPTQNMFGALSLYASRSHFKFIWFPVHFLQQGAVSFREIAKYPHLIEKKWDDQLDQVGFATGIQAFSRHFFLELNGYDESFRGYGCEDIEMLHRASISAGFLDVNKIDEEYIQDYRTKDRNLYRGFRKYFASIIEKKIDTSYIYCFHIWHNRRAKRPYRQMRKQNDEILYRKLNDAL